ncbi:PREDICTED: beta-1,4-mannosyltransferase egh-like [Priapulus caudatus]|uniref:Beta-1,4-mannosyltransferase egh-like n=1 Tax=Priapulus caudatus TaxID=37621 RepID=A0ABM1E9Y5_PRICU|nr:PREDICTED: beta-1,4-mannosyltransferase egh-like [Priapulus caudatus]XP_014669005.1 PREDICTED: beta-1,4-mannosyltransferase egh-like [Priapulus caudatus]XP_014669006.1 PREDICTED: beta-1,4-mannosyltransferase egh-like [Priapulus caudatus]
MALASKTKHALHCCACIGFIVGFQLFAGGIRTGRHRFDDVRPLEDYGVVLTVILYVLRLLTLLPLPMCIFEFVGLLFFNAFPERPTLKGSPLLCPHVCVRVVTRGDYPQLVRDNVTRNVATCLDVGMDNFSIEVVTDHAVRLPKSARVREIVVPSSYKTKSGALFKARALQYCLEDDVNSLSDDDWIVHLDEETLLTENSMRGIINFVMDGKRDFGQGLITYANEDVVNWLTTLADMIRVAMDMGRIRAQFRIFHRPLFAWKGSYVVARARAERAVTFDHGPAGSIAEDSYFAIVAARDGYTFDFIDGEMWEKSPFTVHDFLQQRKRWMQGIYLVVTASALPWRNKWLLAVALYAWVTMPLATSNVVLAAIFPIPCPQVFDIVVCFTAGMTLYMYAFGVVKSFSAYRVGVVRLALLCAGAICTIPFNVVIENIAVTWALFGNKYRFYVVGKELKPAVIV